MIENIFETEELKSLARLKRSGRVFRTVKNQNIPEHLSNGWQVQRKNKKTSRVFRPKRHDILLEDRVWFLLYAMGFTHLSGEGGAFLLVDPKSEAATKNQIDVVGLNPEVAIAVECKSSSTPRKDGRFQEYLAKHSVIRQRFVNSVKTQFPSESNRVPVLLLFTWNLIVSDHDEDRAREQKVVLLNEHDLKYYEQLVAHLGPAAKYQFFADMLPDRQIPGLRTAVPALETKVGPHTCYSFSITPEYLLKIAFVSHRAKGKASDIDTYQRMIKRSRLKNIKEYIDNGGMFPTNIVVSIEGRRSLRFDKGKQEGGPEGARYGTLHLAPSYRSAWIIDGQHRLFAYSGLDRARSSHLSVLAFNNLPASKQAQLFIDINHEQKSVKRSLLQELYAELNWDADEDDKRLGAIVSKAIQALNEDKDSPLWGRILLSDDAPTDQRCISLTSIFSALNQPDLFIVKKNIQYGPLWAGDNSRTLKRTLRIVKAWFGWIRDGAEEWWELGRAEGGGLAMNDGVAVCIGVLRSVLQHLLSKNFNLITLEDTELVEVTKAYGEALGEYFGSMSVDKRRAFRSLRGNQGRASARRRCEAALKDQFPNFSPPGLEEFLNLEAAQTNEKGFSIIQRVETTLQKITIDALKAEYGDGQDETWWYSGIPESIRKKAAERQEEDQGKGKKESYLDLVDFRTIAVDKWTLFKDLLAFDQRGNKRKQTEWIVKLNEMRKIVMHPAKQQVLTWDELSELEKYDQWINEPSGAFDPTKDRSNA